MGIIKGIRDSISRAVDRLFAEDEQKRIGIYGPPNAGKCLAADEQVLLSDGTYASIEEVFESARDACPEAEDVSDEPNETWLPVRDADLEVPALSGDLQTAHGEVSHVFRQRYEGPMYRVRTRSGRSVTVSPEHPFVAVTERGVEEVKARNIEEGMPVAALGQFAPDTDEWTLTANSALRSDGGSVVYESTYHDPKPIEPLSIDREVARFLALTIAEAQHEERYVAFANEDSDLREEFRSTAREFGIDPTTYDYEDKTPIVRVNSRSLVEHLKRLDCHPASSRNKSVPESVLTDDDETVAAFLRAMFDCEGSVQGADDAERGRYVTLSSASRDLVVDIQILLLRFGIFGRIREKTHDGRSYYELLIGRSEQHRAFRRHVGFDDEGKARRLDELCRAGSRPTSHTVPMMPLLERIRDRMGMTQKAFYGDGKHVARMRRRNSISLDRLSSMADSLPNTEATAPIRRVADGDAVWDEVVAVEEETYHGYIYDLTVDEHHTFATRDGLVVHNTTLANRIARDWTGDAVGPESKIPHETRRARRKENVEIERNGKTVSIDIVDTPGVTTKVDYEEFLEYDMEEEDAVRRSREATEGVAEAMHWLREDVDGVIYVLDSTEDPFTQVNTMLVGIIESQDLPVLILANKIDLEESSTQRIKNAFPQHETIPLSALEGDNMDDVYDEIADCFG